MLLVALSSVLLRSQTLLSSARSINFEPTDPAETANTMSVDVQVSVFIIMACLVLPLIIVLKPFGIFRTLFSLIKNSRGQARKRHKHMNDRAPSPHAFDMEQVDSPAGPQSTNDTDSEETKTVNAALPFNLFGPQTRDRVGPSSANNGTVARIALYSSFSTPQLLRPAQPSLIGSSGSDFPSVVPDISRNNKVMEAPTEQQQQVGPRMQVNSVHPAAS
jgi:hypothetical protein